MYSILDVFYIKVISDERVFNKVNMKAFSLSLSSSYVVEKSKSNFRQTNPGYQFWKWLLAKTNRSDGC